LATSQNIKNALPATNDKHSKKNLHQILCLSEKIVFIRTRPFCRFPADARLELSVEMPKAPTSLQLHHLPVQMHYTAKVQNALNLLLTSLYQINHIAVKKNLAKHHCILQ